MTRSSWFVFRQPLPVTDDLAPLASGVAGDSHRLQQPDGRIILLVGREVGSSPIARLP